MRAIPPDDTALSTGVAAVAAGLVITGAWFTLGMLMDLAGPSRYMVATGLAALATLIAGLAVLRGRPWAVLAAFLASGAALFVTVVEALVIGLDTYLNPLTVGYSLFLVAALWVLGRRMGLSEGPR